MTGDSPPLVLTLGHSNREWDVFAALVQANQVEAVVDVRSMPASRRYPWFNRKRLEEGLAGIGIGYRFFGDRLGGRPKDAACYTSGAVDYAKVARTSAFREGLDELAGLARTKCCCLLCSEKDPLDCHRSILVARHLAPKGFSIAHIHDLAKVEGQGAFEQRLLAADDAPLLSEVEDSRALLSLAYDRRSRRIAFRA